MKVEYRNLLVEIADNIGLEYNIEDHYSGRGMYDIETIGIIMSQSNMLVCVAHAAARLQEELTDYQNSIDGEEDQPLEPEVDLDDFIDAVGDLRTDNMGHDTIWY